MKYQEVLRHIVGSSPLSSQGGSSPLAKRSQGGQEGGPLRSNRDRADETLSVKYLHALSGMTREQMELFQDAWSEMGVERRRLVVRRLAELTEISFEVSFDPIFFLAMGDDDGEVRAAAIRGLWENEARGLIPVLIHLLKSDESDDVRAAAAEALGRFVLLGEMEKIDAATAALVEDSLRATIENADETVETRRRAVESIAYSSQAGVPQIIRAAYHSDADTMQVSALCAMGRSADPSRWRNLVVAQLRNQNPELRYESARACGELELAPAVPRLGEMAVRDGDPEVRQAAVWALGSIGGKEAQRMLEACCESDDESLSDAAAAALDEMDLFGGDTHGAIALDDEDEDEWQISNDK